MNAPSTPQRQLTLGFENVSQHNLLVRHPMRMGLYEARIFALMLRCIHRNMETLPPIKVSVKDVVGCEKPNKKMYSLIEQACDSLFKKELNLLDPKAKKTGSFSKVRIVQDLTHIEGTGFVQGTFAEKIKDYLLNLKDEFTLGEIDQLMRLRNANSHRFYWFLKSWDDKDAKIFPIDEFREIILGPDHTKYSQYGQFKRAILVPAMEELAKVGFNVEYKELSKGGKAITGLHFFFPKKKAKKAEAPVKKLTAAPDNAVQVVNHDPEYKKVLNSMKAPILGLTDPQIESILVQLYDDHHDQKYARVHAFLYQLKIYVRDNKGTIHTPGAFSYKKFQGEFGIK